MSPSAFLRRAARAFALTTVGVLALAACGNSSGPSISTPGRRADQAATSTTSSTTTPASTSTTTSTTVTTTAAPSNGQRVTYSGLQFTVPTTWPVYSLTSDPNRCVRLDQNAVYLGQGGPIPQCPARVLGHTETVQVQPLNTASQSVSALATQAQTVNGLPARVDPNAGTAGAFTVVFPDQGVVATITFRDPPVLAAQILQSFQRAP